MPRILLLGRAAQKGQKGDRLLADLQTLGDLHGVPETPSDVDSLRELLRDREILVLDPVPYVFISQEMFRGTPLSFITVTTSGYDHVDVKGAKALGIPVAHVPFYARQAVAEQTMALLLALFRKVAPADAFVRSGSFDFRPFLGTEIAGKIFGIVGLGDIGSRVALLAQAFGATVIASDIRPRRVPGVQMVGLEQLLMESDIVSLHADLNPTSRLLMGREQFERMRPTAVFVNTARGRLVDEVALASTLADRKIAGAALDVLTVEKPGTQNPLFQMPHVVFSPHVAFCTQEALDRRNETILDNVKGFLAGKPIHLVAAEELVPCP